MPGDIARISYWGTINGIPILIGAWLTKEIFDKYYQDWQIIFVYTSFVHGKRI
jgi:hypothetical protein